MPLGAAIDIPDIAESIPLDVIFWQPITSVIDPFIVGVLPVEQGWTKNEQIFNDLDGLVPYVADGKLYVLVSLDYPTGETYPVVTGPFKLVVTYTASTSQ